MVDVQWIGVIRIYYICIVLDVITFHNSLVNNQRSENEERRRKEKMSVVATIVVRY